MNHGGNIRKTETIMDMVTIYTFTFDRHAMPHWKCVLQCFPTDQILLYLLKSQIIMTQKCAQQYASYI